MRGSVAVTSPRLISVPVSAWAGSSQLEGEVASQPSLGVVKEIGTHQV